ncbi:MAG: Uma2 family endonuclease [Gemmataceae bacterium]
MNPSTTSELMTADEFLAWCERPENAEHQYELDRGRIVEMGSPGEWHGLICWNLLQLLVPVIVTRGGYILPNDTGLKLEQNPATIRGADLSIYTSVPDGFQPGHKPSEHMPNFVIEVRSPSDRTVSLLRKVQQYQQAGIALVWVVDPDERAVLAYRPGQFPEAFEEFDTLIVGAELPEFRCLVAELFRVPGEPHA